MEERITRGKAIRLKCLDCCWGNSAEVRRMKNSEHSTTFSRHKRK